MTDSNLLPNDVVGSEALRQPVFKNALDECMADIMALDGTKLARQNVDVPTILTTVMGALPDVRKLKAPCAESYPKSDNSNFDKLEKRLLALGYAYAQDKAASQPTMPVQQVSEKLLKLRVPLEADLRAAAVRGYVEQAPLSELPNTMGYKNQAMGTLTLTALARGSWPRLQGKTAITESELDEAELLAHQLLSAVGERDEQPVAQQAAADIKARAYTLLVRTYDAIRRDVSHLRWDDGDLDQLVPALRSKLSKRKPSEASEVEPEPPAPTSHESGVVPAISAPASDVPVGMPGADPFIKSAKG